MNKSQFLFNAKHGDLFDHVTQNAFRSRILKKHTFIFPVPELEINFGCENGFGEIFTTWPTTRAVETHFKKPEKLGF